MINKLDNTLNFHHKALNVRAARQELLAGNIANADTPGFKARDVKFAQALQHVLSSNPAQQGLTTTSPRHINPVGYRSIGTAQAQYRVPQQPSIDGNTVDMDTERMQFADNSIQYDAGLTFINNQIRVLLSAIREGNV
ncbi:flagellar basal body rod protein FlgB [Nitrosomonas halophila]|uniref:Flagellar basal body rod protein FlgB n=1 Tax=Nitrosomonas halophila TaxID=44576 RepID=A0A1H3H7P8_9PROT|nr:flagellar basal body rod protein FlgB [Nitrosomonas halophila]SDY11245.1 flagellar basal-body rod protein FlgB [Nitrosomonas halophila]HRQ05029.1 flagellar basal body rod protein FlgB [Nitrosomonas halophila]